METYLKKPQALRAKQWTGVDGDELCQWIKAHDDYDYRIVTEHSIYGFGKDGQDDPEAPKSRQALFVHSSRAYNHTLVGPGDWLVERTSTLLRDENDDVEDYATSISSLSDSAIRGMHLMPGDDLAGAIETALLMADPEFIISLGQMRRGEGKEIDTAELMARHKPADETSDALTEVKIDPALDSVLFRLTQVDARLAEAVEQALSPQG